jgi:alpha-mannosidase II
MEIFSNQFPERGPLTVHMVHFSHVDVGWLMTYQEYFDNYVGKIISSSIKALKNDDKRKFSWMEMKYFVMWWST